MGCLAGRLIALDKTIQESVCSIAIGEKYCDDSLRKMCIHMSVWPKEKRSKLAESISKPAIEGGVHAMQSLWNIRMMEEVWEFLLIDARSAFG